MRQIRYNDNTNVVKFEFPTEWDPKLVTAVDISITNKDGTELLASDSVTLFTATTLDTAATRFARQVTLDSGTDALNIGDKILITGDLGDETAYVKGFESVNKVVEITSTNGLRNPHESGDAVYGAFGTYTIDTTTVATFTAGLVMTLTWTPTGAGQPITELAQIAKSAFDIIGLEQRFKNLYARAYDDFTEPYEKFADMQMEAEQQVENELLGNGLDLQRVVDQSKLAPLVMAKMAYLWTLNGDENKQDEYEKYKLEYGNEFDRVLQWPLWVDRNQDLIEDDQEVSSHNHIFIGSW